MTGFSRQDILATIIQAIARAAGAEPAELNEQTRLVADLNLDSLAMFEIVIDLEEAFGLQISDEDIDKIKTIGDILEYVERAVNRPGK
jgi:acyl carrier protein